MDCLRAVLWVPVRAHGCECTRTLAHKETHAHAYTHAHTHKHTHARTHARTPDKRKVPSGRHWHTHEREMEPRADAHTHALSQTHGARATQRGAAVPQRSAHDARIDIGKLVIAHTPPMVLVQHLEPARRSRAARETHNTVVAVRAHVWIERGQRRPPQRRHVHPRLVSLTPASLSARQLQWPSRV